MLHFFRIIRRDLVENSQFFKYLKYAIGEIVLVVIGILIALYINNWNEDRKGDENTKLLFKEVGDELLQNIKSIDRIIDIYIVKDSLYFEVLKKNVDHEDYKNSLFLSSFPNWWNRTSLVDEDFKELLSRKENLTELQDSIFSELKELYSKRKVNTDYDDETIRNTQHNFREKMVNELPWFSDWEINNRVTDEMIKYYLNDPYYMNQLAEIKFREYWHAMGMLWFRTKALNLYKKIADMLNIENDTTLVRSLIDFERIKGIYDGGDYRFEISGDNELKSSLFVNGTKVMENNIHPYSNSHLIIFGREKAENWFGKIEYGKGGEVVGLSWFGNINVVEGKRSMAKKIE